MIENFTIQGIAEIIIEISQSELILLFSPQTQS